MTTLRKGGFVREMQRVKAEKRKKPYEEYVLGELKAREQEGGYSAWCKDGISGEYGMGLRRSGYALTKTNAEIDAELNQTLQDLHVEGVEIGHE